MTQIRICLHPTKSQSDKWRSAAWKRKRAPVPAQVQPWREKAPRRGKRCARESSQGTAMTSRASHNSVFPCCAVATRLPWQPSGISARRGAVLAVVSTLMIQSSSQIINPIFYCYSSILPLLLSPAPASHIFENEDATCRILILILLLGDQ